MPCLQISDPEVTLLRRYILMKFPQFSEDLFNAIILRLNLYDLIFVTFYLEISAQCSHAPFSFSNPLLGLHITFVLKVVYILFLCHRLPTSF